MRGGGSRGATEASPGAVSADAAAPRSSRGGRPRKFDEPSRPVTVTLPDSTLEQLARLDGDRAKAIAKAARTLVAGPGAEPFLTEVVRVDRSAGLVVVGPSRHLRSVQCIRLVEIVPGRSILSVPSGTAPETIELALADLLDEVPVSEPIEREMIRRLLEIFRTARKRRGMMKVEIVLLTSV